MRLLVLLFVVLTTTATVCIADTAGGTPPFKDVPANHWAADAVGVLSQDGILKGYPDGDFRGDQPVTRFELAVALARFIEVVLPVKVSTDGKGPGTAATAPPKNADWAKESQKFLTNGKYLPSSSPIITDGSRPATARDVAEALAAISVRIIESRVPEDAPEVIDRHDAFTNGQN